MSNCYATNWTGAQDGVLYEYIPTRGPKWVYESGLLDRSYDGIRKRSKFLEIKFERANQPKLDDPPELSELRAGLHRFVGTFHAAQWYPAERGQLRHSV